MLCESKAWTVRCSNADVIGLRDRDSRGPGILCRDEISIDGTAEDGVLVFESELELAPTKTKFVLGLGGEGQVDRTPSLFDAL